MMTPKISHLDLIDLESMLDWMTTLCLTCIGGRSLPWQLLVSFSFTFASCFVSAAVITVFGSSVSSSLRHGMSVL